MQALLQLVEAFPFSIVQHHRSTLVSLALQQTVRLLLPDVSGLANLDRITFDAAILPGSHHVC